MFSLPNRQVPALHHRRVGDIVVTAVGDGYLEGSLSVLRNIAEDEAARLLRLSFRPVPRRTSVNCYLLQLDGRTALIDCGCGLGLQESAGKLFENLDAAGVGTADIDLILLTHMHPDHSSGLADRTGLARFPRATVALHEAELAYWNSDDEAARQQRTGRGVPYFAAARAQLAPYHDRIRTFRDGEVFPGVVAMPLPGHTPGHTGYAIASDDESLLVWGDIVHLPEVQIPHPDVTIQFDVDPQQATATRHAVLDRVAAEGRLVAGMHLHFPGYGRVVREGADHRLLPEPWKLDF